MTDEYIVGTGIADVTGEAGGIGMMGYGMPAQRTAGIHLRQWARAFLIGENREGGKRIMFVTSDLGMIFTAVHREVLRRLAERFGDRYTTENVVLSATHTHSGPGGFGHYTLYNITTGGFHQRTFEAIVSGIVLAIERADANCGPGTISVSAGDLHDANINRSLVSFLNNPEADRDRFPGGIDPHMTVLRLQRAGEPIAVISWFPTHGTSMPNTNRLISSDNKGYAAYLWEHEWAGQGSTAKANGELSFVAGFAQGNAGDMSPNLGPGTAYGPTDNRFLNTRIIGSRQADKAYELFSGPQTPVTGAIDYRQRFVDFSHIEVAARWNNGVPGRTWPAVIGQTMMAGTWDGPGAGFLHQGDLKRNPLMKLVDAIVVSPPPELVAGHAPKPVGVATGICRPVPWTPPVLPLQIIRIGQLAIVAAPGEFTITSGYRIRSAVAQALGTPILNVIFAGYSNAYSGYITTPQEYQIQRYEGGSTHFGPCTLPAYQQEFAAIASALAAGEPTPSSVEPPDLSKNTWSVDPLRHVPDRPGRGRSFGDVTREPKPEYGTGEVVEVEFASACPSNNTRNGSTFLEVQRLEVDGEWHTFATDDDWSTLFRWRRAPFPLSTSSRALVAWSTQPSTPIGTYRIVHNGDARRPGDVQSRPFIGTTRPFTLVVG